MDARVDAAAGIATRNLRFYLLYSLTQGAALYWPYMFHLVVNLRGHTASEFGLLKAIYYVAVVLLEMPLGVLSDRIERRTVLIASASCNAVACGLYVLAVDFTDFAVAELVFALSTSAMSGSGSALLYDSLAHDGREAEYARADGYTVAAWLVAGTIGLPLTDRFLISDGDPTAAYAAAGLLSVVGALAVAAMREAPRSRESARDITRGALRELRHTPGLLSLLLYAACVGVWTRVASALLYNPVLEAGGVPVHTYGSILAVSGLIGAVTAFRTGRLLDRFGAARTRAALPLLMIAMFALLPNVSGFGTAAVLCLQGVATGALPVVVRTGLNERIESSARRATVLSLESIFVRTAYALTTITIGFVLDTATLHHALALTLATGTALWLVSLALDRTAARDRVP